MNMMRFILDCLRPARARAAAAARDTELQAGIKDTSGDNEIKGLKDEVHIEEETLQTTKALCHNTQETVEKLEERKTLLKEELEMIYDLQKQEQEVLQSLQEEQQELEQTLQQYDRELCAAAEDLLQLQQEVAYAKAHAESLHVRISPLQDIFEEIVQVKKKLSELVAGLITGESAVTEMTDHCGVLDQELVGKTDDVESECDRVYSESIMSDEKEEEMDHVELESTIEELDKMQRSLENLKSSGSSSFTEITLTEVKEEDVMFRSTTPQSDSSDMEKEDFEIIQPAQATNKQFDFYHPNPFTDGDVFGDDHFPKVDVTEQLPRDPFKGTDPFASDSLLVDMTKEEHCDDDFITEENNDTLHYPFQSAGKDYGTFNAPINTPLGADFKQSAENLDCCASMSTGLKSYPDADSEIGKDAEQAVSEESSHSSTMSNSFDADPSMFAEVEEDRFEDHAGYSFIKGPNSLCGLQSIIAGSYTGFPLSPCDPEPVSGISDIQKILERHITSEQNAVNDSIEDICHSELENTESVHVINSLGPLSEQSHDMNSNTSNDTQPSPLDVYDYKYGDMFFFTVRLDPGSPEPHNHSPGCPEPSDMKKEESPGQLDAALSPEINDMDELDYCSPQPEDTEQHSQIINAHNHSPGCPEPSDIRKDESPDQLDAALSPEINDMDELDCCSPQTEDTEQHSQIINGRGCFDNGEPDNEANSDPVGNEIFKSDCDRVEIPIPCLPFEDSNACQSEDNSEWDDEAYPTAAESVPDSSNNKSTVQDLLCLFSNTDTSANDLIPESSCSQQNKPESVAMSKYELQYFDPFSPIPSEMIECASDLEEMNTANSFCYEAPRLDSGYHEVGTPTPFSPEPTDKFKCSIDLQGPGLTNSKQSDSEIHVTDPFSPESVDTGIFDSETENCESGYMITKCQLFSHQLVDMDSNNAEEKQMPFINNVSCDILSDHLSGSEPDDCFPFGSCPSNEESYAYSSEEIQFKPGSNASNSSEVIRCGSVWRNSEMGLPNPDVFDTIFDFDTTAVGSFVPNINQNEEEAPHAEKVVKKADLVEIDYFCSELSKMVSSSSSDSVQQSVAEMLFGSEPNTSSFYPWDFEKQQQNC